jgi:hypothetical protein
MSRQAGRGRETGTCKADTQGGREGAGMMGEVTNCLLRSAAHEEPRKKLAASFYRLAILSVGTGVGAELFFASTPQICWPFWAASNMLILSYL